MQYTAHQAVQCPPCNTLHIMQDNAHHAIHCPSCKTQQNMQYTAHHATHCPSCNTLFIMQYTAYHSRQCPSCNTLPIIQMTVTALHAVNQRPVRISVPVLGRRSRRTIRRSFTDRWHLMQTYLLM